MVSRQRHREKKVTTLVDTFTGLCFNPPQSRVSTVFGVALSQQMEERLMVWGTPRVARRYAAAAAVLFALGNVPLASAQTQSRADPAAADASAQQNAPAASATETPRTSKTQSRYGAPDKPVQLPPLPDDPASKQLIGRVEARWKALIDGQFDKVYEFEPPKYRSENTPDQFRKTFGSAVQWHVARVVTLHYDRPDFATVGVLIDHSLFVPWSDTPVRSKAVVKEGWEKVDGQWWHKPTQSKLGMPAEATSGQQNP